MQMETDQATRTRPEGEVTDSELRQREPMGRGPLLSGLRPWVMWGLAALAYLLAVFHRMSLAVVAGPAAHRLHLQPSGLATLGSVEVFVYFLMQIPSGIGADRLGPRRMLAGGLAFLGLGSLLFAVAGNEPVAVAGRLLIGLGDSLIFVNVLRVARAWFPGSRFAFVASLTAVVGGAGQFLATAPLGAVLGRVGWVATFAGAGAITLALAVIIAIVLREAPVSSRRRAGARPASKTTSGDGTDTPSTAAGTQRSAGRPSLGLAAAWHEPGTRLAFWGHFVLVGSFVAFSGLWGAPYLQQAVGLSAGQSALGISLLVVVSIVASPFVGRGLSRHPHHRATFVLVSMGIDLAAWLTMVAVPASWLPTFVIAALLAAIGFSNAASVAVFDIARSANPAARAGTATGLVNMAGFGFAVVAELVIGQALTLFRGMGMSQGDAYRAAFAAVGVLVVVGVAAAWRYRSWRAEPVKAHASMTDHRNPCLGTSRSGSPTSTCADGTLAA